MVEFKMKTLLHVIVIIWLLINSVYSNEHLEFGIPGTNGILLYKQNFVLLHDYNKKIPLYASYHLVSSNITTYKKNGLSFKPDEELPVEQRAELSHYRGSAYGLLPVL